jgi:hypothetical protein
MAEGKINVVISGLVTRQLDVISEGLKEIAQKPRTLPDNYCECGAELVEKEKQEHGTVKRCPRCKEIYFVAQSVGEWSGPISLKRTT